MTKLWDGNYFNREDVMRNLREVALEDVRAITHNGKYSDAEKLAMVHGIFAFLNDTEDSMVEEAPADDANT